MTSKTGSKEEPAMTTSQGASIGFEIRVTDQPVPAAERARLMAVPGFGRVFTDHMITMAW